MFYKFNSFSGRLMPSTQTEAYSPQGLNPTVCEPSRIIFDSKKTRIASNGSTPVRSSTSSKSSPAGHSSAGGGVVPANARYKRIQELQNHFLKNDGRLVWQKMGVWDAVPYWTTLGLCVVGTLLTANLFCNLIFPKRK